MYITQYPVIYLQVFLVRKIVSVDAGKLFAMKVLRKASLKGIKCSDTHGLLHSLMYFLQYETECVLKWREISYLM